jgi:SAM-dependent methyltransferase
MKQNKYDENEFFSAYKELPRSVKGLDGAGEWHLLKEMLPDLRNKDVLDLGCGFGWHCRYAREQSARSVVGVDISDNMLQQARALTQDHAISYLKTPIEDLNFQDRQFDVVLSSLAFHYLKSFEDICQNIYRLLTPGGCFVFSVEHPIFTSRQEQDWHYDSQGNRLHWAVDHYQDEGIRDTSFLADHVIKYHRTLATYINNVVSAGFAIKEIRESVPSKEMLENNPDARDELRRPMFLLISAAK